MNLITRSTASRVLLAAVTTLAFSPAIALDYSCDDLADMAERLYLLKADGYELNEVHGTILESSRGDYQKEKLLGNLAIEIFVDPDIDSVEKSQRLAHVQCGK